MEESSFETFEEELGKPVQDVPPPKPIRQARTGSRAEMYAQRRLREEAPILQQVPKMIPREHPVSGAASLRKALSIQNLTQIETPWEGVTLNRCLIVAIAILLLTSGLQRIHDSVRGRKDEEITALNERHNLIKRGKITPREQDNSLWGMLFWWLDDDDDDDDDGKSKRANGGRVSRSLRHRALPDLRLLKTRGTHFPERRARGRRGQDEVTDTLTRRREREMKDKKEEEMKKLKKPAKESKKKPAKESKP